MLLNFLETKQITFENKINSRYKCSKYLPTISSILVRKNPINNIFSLSPTLTEDEIKKMELIKIILKKRRNSVLCLQRNFRKYFPFYFKFFRK